MRYWFGGSVPDFVIAPGQQIEREDGGIGYLSLLAPNVPLWVYDPHTGERVTDLLDAHSETVDEILSGPYGELPRFRGPDEVRELSIGQALSASDPEEEDGSDEEPPRFSLVTNEIMGLLASAERRIADLEESTGEGETTSTSHPLMWHVDGEVTPQRSHGVYTNLEGRSQRVTGLRARLTEVSPDTVVTVRLLALDPDTGTDEVLGEIDLSASRTSHRIWPDETLTNGAELTTEVELTGGGSAEHLTVQVMIR